MISKIRAQALTLNSKGKHKLDSTQDMTGFTYKLRRYLEVTKKIVLGRNFAVVIDPTVETVLILDNSSNYYVNIHSGRLIKTTGNGCITS